MSGATVSGGVAGEGSAWAAELVVECDRGGECCEACGEADTEVLQGASAVTLEGEDVLAGPEDALDALAYRCEVRTAPGLVLRRGRMIFASRVGEFSFEVFATEVLIADQDQRLAGLALTTLDEL